MTAGNSWLREQTKSEKKGDALYHYLKLAMAAPKVFDGEMALGL